MRRYRFPNMFADATDSLAENIEELKENEPDQLAIHKDVNERSEEWACITHKGILDAAKPTQQLIAADLKKQDTAQLWMTAMDRIGLIALLINEDPKLPAFVQGPGKHTLPSLVFEMLSTIHSAYWETGETNLFGLNKHHLNNGGMLASLLCHSDYKLGLHPAGIQLNSTAVVGAVFAILCRALRLHSVKATYFDGLLHTAMEHLLILHANKGRDPKHVGSPLIPPALNGSTTLKEAQAACLQNNHQVIKELAQTTSALYKVFDARATADDITHEAIDRGLWAQRLLEGSAQLSGAVLQHDPATFTWQNTRARSLSFVDVEVLLARHAHHHGLYHILEMVRAIRKLQSAFSPVYIELKDIHAANVQPSMAKVLPPGSFYLVTYLSDTDNHYNTLVVAPSNAWAAYQSYSIMRSLLSKVETEGRDITRLPFAPLLFQLLTTSGASLDAAGMRVAYSILGTWFGLGDLDPIDICPDHKKLKANQDALQFVLGQITDELKAGHTDADRWVNLSLVAKALILGVLDKRDTVAALWQRLCGLVPAGYHDHPKYMPVAEEILSLVKVTTEEKATKPNTTYEDWYALQRQCMRPRVESTTVGGCNHAKGCGQAFYRFLVQTEMQSLQYGVDRIELAMRSFIDHKSSEPKDGKDEKKVDKDGDTEMTKIHTAAHSYHGCLSMFDPALAWVRPDSHFVYGNTQVFVWRRQYDQYCDLSDTFQWFLSSFHSRIDPELFRNYNACAGKPVGQAPAVLSPTAKRPRDVPVAKETKEKKARQDSPFAGLLCQHGNVAKDCAACKSSQWPPCKVCRAHFNPSIIKTIDGVCEFCAKKKPPPIRIPSPPSPPYDPNTSPVYRPEEMYSPTSPAYDTGAGYQSTSPSPAMDTSADHEEVKSPCSPAFSPIRSIEEKSSAQAARERRQAAAEAGRAEQARLKKQQATSAPHPSVVARSARDAQQVQAVMKRLKT